MSEAIKIALTAVGGVTVYVAGQLVAKFLIEPIYEQKKLIGAIAATIIFYSNVGCGMEQYYYDQIKAFSTSDDAHKDIVIDRYKSLLNEHWEKSFPFLPKRRPVVEFYLLDYWPNKRSDD